MRDVGSDGRWVVDALSSRRLGVEACPVRVLIADDQPLIRAGLRVILDHQPDIEVIGEVR